MGPLYKPILQSINSISYRSSFTLILPYNLPVIIPMHELNQIYELKPTIGKVNLEFKHIKDLSPLIPVLERMANL